MQWGWSFAPAFVVTAFVSIPIVAADELSSLDKALVIGVLIFSLVAVVVLCRLEFMVSDGQVVTSFGPGWPRRIVALETVAPASARRIWWPTMPVSSARICSWSVTAWTLQTSTANCPISATSIAGNGFSGHRDAEIGTWKKEETNRQLASYWVEW